MLAVEPRRRTRPGLLGVGDVDLGRGTAEPVGHLGREEVVREVELAEVGQALPGEQRLAALVGQLPTGEAELVEAGHDRRRRQRDRHLIGDLGIADPSEVNGNGGAWSSGARSSTVMVAP